MTACIQVDLKHIIQDEAGVGDLDTLEIGIELKDFYPSVECDFWQVLEYIQHTRCCFNVRSKADMSQLNLPHGKLNLPQNGLAYITARRPVAQDNDKQ